jgi:hypothetical protein
VEEHGLAARKKVVRVHAVDGQIIGDFVTSRCVALSDRPAIVAAKPDTDRSRGFSGEEQFQRQNTQGRGNVLKIPS